MGRARGRRCLEPSSDLARLKLTAPQERGLRLFAAGMGRRIHHRTFRALIDLGLIGPDMFTGGFTLTDDGRAHLGTTNGR
jgi:hypothetical protein